LFPVPKLYGALHRTGEYPECGDAFRQAGDNQSWLFGTTQASRIGGETFYIQHDPRIDGESLLCTLNSIMPAEGEYPFINHEKPLTPRAQERMKFLFGDVGCVFFLIDEKGQVRWTMNCY
jgi:hypothetical protein